MSYVWLIDVRKSISNISNIRLDSDIKILIDRTGGYELIAVYNVDGQLRNVSYANWTEKTGFSGVITDDPFQSSLRRNLEGSVFKTGVYVSTKVTLVTFMFINVSM